VVCSMTGEERNGDLVVLEDSDGRGWISPRCLWVHSCNRNVAIELLQTGTSNDCNVNRS